MKRVVLGLIFVCAFLLGNAQTQVYRGQPTTVVNALAPADLVGADTTIYVLMPLQYSATWVAEVQWATVTGTGTYAIMTSIDESVWEAYYGSPSASITGASGNYVYEDYMFSGKWLGFKITKGTISAGTVTVKLLLR